VPLRWVGFAVEDDYVVGYGLGHAERYRNLPLVAAADLAALRADPDALLGELYGAENGPSPPCLPEEDGR
jgi:hypothetical protein